MAKDRYRYFRVEARELLEALSRGVLDLERAPGDKALVARLLRHAHTLKGAARVVQQGPIGDLAHAAEDALEPHRDGGTAPVTREHIDALLRILDEIAGHVQSLEPRPEASPAGALAAPPEETIESVRVDVRDLDALLSSTLEAAVQVSGLRRQIARLEHAHEVARILGDALAARRGEGDVGGRARPLADELRRTLSDARRALATRADEAEREVAQVRTFADRLRLVPVRTLFGGLERAVRDAARSLHRDATFVASGGDLRVDANVLGAVRAALLHVVRNAVAHGIEPPDERIRHGKPRSGRVSLQVERRGRRVAFVCRDDGRGIDTAAVRAVAARKGIALPEDARPGPRGDLADLLLRGGMSTRPAVDEVSGRGIGLDVLRDVATRLKAEVALRTDPGLGTTVELEVPTSIAAIAALHVEAWGAAVAIPLEAVRETSFVEPSAVAPGPGGPSLVRGERVLPFAPLGSVLGRDAPPGERRFWSAIVIESGAEAVVLGADRLLGTWEVVVRPLPEFVRADPIVAGVALDAEGQPRLVLDAAGVVARARLTRTAPGEAAERRRAPVLVIDDSLTTRMLEQSILESAGYDVEVAVSAEAALEKARARRFGVFVVDVEMPGMDGLEFVRVTRADPRLATTPAILVTSRGAPEDRKKGLEVGASAYIVKSEFDQTQLLAHIAELLG